MTLEQNKMVDKYLNFCNRQLSEQDQWFKDNVYSVRYDRECLDPPLYWGKYISVLKSKKVTIELNSGRKLTIEVGARGYNLDLEPLAKQLTYLLGTYDEKLK